MAELKTKVTNASVLDFINSVPDEIRKKDGLKLLKIFERLTSEKAKMWGTSIIGFGKYHYKSERSSQEGDWPLTGFSPRKQALTLYVLCDDSKQKELMNKLGKHTRSVSCLYIKKLDDVDLEILEKIIEICYKQMKSRYP